MSTPEPLILAPFLFGTKASPGNSAGTDGDSLKFPGATLPHGTIGYLKGGNGSGKSTFLTALASRPEIFSASIYTRASIFHLGQSYESFLYPYKPIWWNVSLPLIVEGTDLAVARAKAEAILHRFNLHISSDQFASKKLSGGEKHIVLLARMLIGKQSILLLDEPTTAVDAANIETFHTLLYETVQQEGKWAILTSHELLTNGPSVAPIQFTGVGGQTLEFITFTPRRREQ